MVYFHSKDGSSVYFARLKQLLTEAMENTQGMGKAHSGNGKGPPRAAESTWHRLLYSCFIPAPSSLSWPFMGTLWFLSSLSALPQDSPKLLLADPASVPFIAAFAGKHRRKMPGASLSPPQLRVLQIMGK